MISKELRLLIWSIQVSLFEKNKKEFLDLLNNKKLDWEKVSLLATYHEIVPVLYNACKVVRFSNEYVQAQQADVLRQAIKNIFYEKELLRLLTLLSQAGVHTVPYKGILFLNKLYDSRPIRKIIDMDILVTRKDAVMALQILLNDGYSFIESDGGLPKLDAIVSSTPNMEVVLVKRTQKGMPIFIDFHWHISAYGNYDLDIGKLVSQTELNVWNGRNVQLPTTEGIFIMLLNHHSGRDCWVRLKYIADLLAFLKSYPHISDQQLIQWAQKVRMKMGFSYGLALLNSFFLKEFNLDFIPDKRILNDIVKMWENGEFWNQVFPKLILLSINRRLQDQHTSWLNILDQQISYHAKSGISNDKRVITFHEKYTCLNALSKLAGYLKERVRQTF